MKRWEESLKSTINSTCYLFEKPRKERSKFLECTLCTSASIHKGKMTMLGRIMPGSQAIAVQTKQPPAKAGGFNSRTESPDTGQRPVG